MTTPPSPKEKWSPNPSWNKIVDVPSQYMNCEQPLDPTERAISIRQLEQLGDLIKCVLRRNYYPKYVYDDNGKKRIVGPITKINISMYDINNYFVKPLTNDCSYVEMIAKKPQKPNFFVSHYWGTSFFDTLDMLKLHAKHRGLSETHSYYWICTFANNQHNVSADLNTNDADYRNTPFARALLTEGCKGTLLLLDEYMATPFSRLWCVFELFITTILSRQRSILGPLLFDVGTIIPALECVNELGQRNQRCAGVLLEDGMGDVFSGDQEFTDHAEDSSGGIRRAWFPARVSKHGFLADVREGSASRKEDEKWILGIIKGKEDKVNQAVRRKLFRSAAYMSATALGSPRMLEYVMTKKEVVSKTRALKIADEDGIVSATAGYNYFDKRNKCLRFLLEFGCDPNVVSASRRGENERHPLESACRVRNPDHVIILLQNGSDPNFTYANDGPTLDEKINDPKAMLIMRRHDAGKKNCKEVECALRRHWKTGSLPNRIKSLFAKMI